MSFRTTDVRALEGPRYDGFLDFVLVIVSDDRSTFFQVLQLKLLLVLSSLTISIGNHP